MSAEIEPYRLVHSVPDEELTVPLAQDLMQRHFMCTLDSCACKKAAYWKLAESGVLTPDSGRPGWGL